MNIIVFRITTIGFSSLQAGKHEAIVKNVHDLLAKLAWDFSPEQLDHLFDCFKVSKTLFIQSLTDYKGFLYTIYRTFSLGCDLMKLQLNYLKAIYCCTSYITLLTCSSSAGKLDQC